MDRHITAGESAIGRRVDREVSGPLGGRWKTSRRWSAPNPTTFSANEGGLFRSQLEEPAGSGLLLGRPGDEAMLTMKELDIDGLEKAAALG